MPIELDTSRMLFTAADWEPTTVRAHPRDVPHIWHQFAIELARAAGYAESQVDLYFGMPDVARVMVELIDGAPSLPKPSPRRAFYFVSVEGGYGTVMLVDTTNGQDLYVTWDSEGVGRARAENAALIAWVFDNPDLVDREVRDVAPKPSKKAKRRGKTHEPSPVTVVDLRASHRTMRGEVEKAEREYRHRWIVRGHWHNYWVGPKDDRELAPRWVPTYVKGPDGAPLNVTTKVSKL